MSDVVLLTPREISTGAASLNNQNVLINDEEYLRLDPAMRLFYKRVRENLGVACIAGHLRHRGYSVTALNLHGRNPSDEAITALVRQERPVFVGISIMYDLHIIDAVRLLRCVRAADPSVFVAIGGAFCTYNAKLIAERVPEADCVAYGEGELTAEGLMDCLAAGRDWRQVPGLYFWRDGRVSTSGPPKLPDLAAEPWPARDLLLHHRATGIPTPRASTYTSRGCHAKCTFCYAPRQPGVEGGPWRVRPIVDAVDEIEFLQREFGTRFVWFNDDNFGGAFAEGYQHAVGFAEEVLRRNLKVSFHCEFRVDTGLIDREALRTLRRAGMELALLGMETGSPGMMKRFRKGTTVDYNFDAARMFKQERIELEPGWIMIEPGTTVDELWQNLEFIVAARVHECENPFFLINRAIALRGTEIYDKVTTYGEPDIPGVDGVAWEVLRQARREYRVADERVEDLWSAWSAVSSDINDRKENEVPFLAQRIADTVRARRGGAGPDVRPLLSRLRRWDQSLDRLLVAFLNTGLLLADLGGPDLAARLETALRGLVEGYDRCHLGAAFPDFAVQIEQACQSPAPATSR
ncbi:radical SAM protein [Crossiella sp. CA-258035]|uniref:B12-binding domain-containing radical SAM protein n=1 Tax=Crossiella sp. CA-258035 TaxID=2981138 RepID=UPI0024BBFC50|nr:radical SAM protein [Crossiella sp. CA-258035]WHT23230.1 radical SAM protein [Crossiella sp. CA-258035]